ncbi:hypothetical protein VaNZ11_008964, partial [Volvox africanus]
VTDAAILVGEPALHAARLSLSPLRTQVPAGLRPQQPPTRLSLSTEGTGARRLVQERPWIPPAVVRGAVGCRLSSATRDAERLTYLGERDPSWPPRLRGHIMEMAQSTG